MEEFLYNRKESSPGGIGQYVSMICRKEKRISQRILHKKTNKADCLSAFEREQGGWNRIGAKFFADYLLFFF